LTEYHENGQLKEKGTFNNGEPNGPSGLWLRYYENGQLSEKYTYKDGWRNGRYEWYYENGQLKEKGTCKDGICDF